MIPDERQARSDGGKVGSIVHRTHDGKHGRGRVQEMPICPWNPKKAPKHRKRLKMKIAPNNRLITKGLRKCSQ